MAAKKKAKTKQARSGGAKRRVMKRKRPLKPPFLIVDGKPCTLKDICKFLGALSTYLQAFNVDYTALRIAVCNVEKQAFSGNGNANKPPRFCSGGGGNEPAAPPPPPVW